MYSSGCSKAYMNIYDGEFQVFNPQYYTGNTHELKDSKNASVSAGAAIGGNTSIRLPGMQNIGVNQDDPYDFLPDSSANIKYRMIMNSLFLNFEYQNKQHVRIVGAGLGLAPYPYVYGKLGINAKYFDLSVNSLAGINFNNASYSGEALKDNHTFAGQYWIKTDINRKNDVVVHSYFSFGLNNSFYFKGFALSYTGSIVYPMGLLNDIENQDLSIKFPNIVSQEVYASYFFGNKYTASMGVGQITSSKFKEELYSVNMKIKYTLK